MTIDFTTRSRNLNLAYIFRGEYNDRNGAERAVHWCGPKSRTGSGLTFPVPIGPYSRGSLGTALWEARMTRCSMDMKLGSITQSIQAITDLNFNVEIQGGPHGDALDDGDLEHDILYGRWRNKRASLWLLDLDTLDTQQVAYGHFDRNPTSITAGVFAVTINVAPIIPDRRFPGTAIPVNEGLHHVWTVTSQLNGGAYGSYYVPASYELNPDHEGKFLSSTFGSSTHAISGVLDDGFIWKELVPYGSRGAAPLGQYVYAHVDVHTNCYVHEVWLELAWNDEDGNTMPELRPAYMDETVIKSFENLDPQRGPVGTNVRLPRLTTGSALSSLFGWTQGARVFARVSGPGSGIWTGTEDSVTGIHIYDVFSGAHQVDATPWGILGNLFTDPQYLGTPGLPSIWAPGSLAEFHNQRPAPHAPNAFAYYQMAGSVPSVPSVSDKQPSVREGLQGLASSFPFDIVHRWDDSTQELKMAPIWRPGLGSEPDHIFTASDLARTDPPELSQFDNANGTYANRVTVKTPDHYTSPTAVPLAETDPDAISQGNQLEHVHETTAVVEDTVEQGPTKENAVSGAERSWKHWLHSGERGQQQAAWFLGIELSQPQRSVKAMHGVRSFIVGMGEAIRYDMRGVNSDTGQIRGLRFNYDKQTVSVESLHIDHYTRSVTPRDVDESMRAAPEGGDDE